MESILYVMEHPNELKRMYRINKSMPSSVKHHFARLIFGKFLDTFEISKIMFISFIFIVNLFILCTSKVLTNYSNYS